jgi:hypothetical protein
MIQPSENDMPNGYTIRPIVGGDFDLYFHEHYVMRRGTEQECRWEARQHAEKVRREEYWRRHQMGA